MKDKKLEAIHEMSQITLGPQVTLDCTEWAMKNGFLDNFIALHNAGYRKIPEGGVVLTKEEYEDLTIAKEHILSMISTNASKETAEKFAKDVLNFIHNETFRKGYELKKVERKVKDLAKKYHVEVLDG